MLGNLLSKDEEGRYHLTEQGRLAVNLLKTFPEGTPKESHLSVLKIATAVVLILLGVFLVVSFGYGTLAVIGPTTMTSTSHVSISTQLVPPNSTIYLLPWSDTGGPLNVSWTASGPVHIYILNQTQYGSLLLVHGKRGQPLLQNFTGSPTSWVDRYYLQSGSVSPSPPQGQYYFFAGSPSQVSLNSFGISESQTQQGGYPQSSFSFILFLAVFIAIGALLIVLGVSILTRRVWR